MKQITIVIPASVQADIEILKQNVDKRVTIIVERGTNPSQNRNRGMGKAKTPYVAFINAHTTISDNWVEEVLSFFQRYPEIDVVGGPQQTFKGDGRFAELSGYALASPFGAGELSARYNPKTLKLDADERQLTSANLICRRNVLTKVKFDEHLYPGEDPKFITDLKKNEFRVAYAPTIVTYNKRRTTVRSFMYQIFTYGRMRPKKESLRETLRHPLFFVPSLFVVYLLVLPVAFYWSAYVLLPLALYVLLAGMYSGIESGKKKDFGLLFVLPWIFLLIHLSYGIGFLTGIFREKQRP